MQKRTISNADARALLVGISAGAVLLAVLGILLYLVLRPAPTPLEERAPARGAPAPRAPSAPARPALPSPPSTTTTTTRRAPPPTTRPAPPPTTRPAPPPRWQLAETVDEMTDLHHVVLCANSDPIRGLYTCMLAIRRADDGRMSVLMAGSDGVGWWPNPPAGLLRIGDEPAERLRIRGIRANVAVADTDAHQFAYRLRGSGEVRIRCDTLLWEDVTFRWPVGPEYGPLLDRLLRGEGPPPPPPSEF